MTEAIRFAEISDNSYAERPHLEIVETDNRPPKLTPEEAERLLEEGPYLARLRAARRVLSITMAYAKGEETAEFIQDSYLERLQNDVKVRQDELRQYDALQIKQVEAVVSVEESTQKGGINSAGRSIEGRDGTGLYLEEIARTPLLNAETEVELSKTIEAGLYAQRILNGDAQKVRRATRKELEWLVEEGDRAKQRFLEANLRLVVSIARKYSWSEMPMLDLIQEGNTGLIRAVEKFDYTKGYKFSTYATWWVRQAITRGLAQQERIVRLPVHVVEELRQVKSAQRLLAGILGHDPEPDEIAAELAMDVDRVIDLLAWGREHVSLDKPVDDDGETSLGDLIAREPAPGPDANVLNGEARARLDALILRLDERSADIIRRRYGLIDGRQHKLADIGVVHGISAERVRQLEREALQTLRRNADPDLEH